MENYDKKIISSYLMYLDANSLYGWAMSQKLPVNGFKWVKKLSKLDERFIKDYDGKSNKGYFLKVDVEYPKDLFNRVAPNAIVFSGAVLNGVAPSLHSDIPFLPERSKIKKCNKLVCSIHDRKLCRSHKSFKTGIKLILKKKINTKKSTQSFNIIKKHV